MAEENLFSFQDLLDAEGETEKDLPREIKLKIQGIKLSMTHIDKYIEKHGEDEAVPQEKWDNIEKQDDAICDMIEQWLKKPTSTPTPPPTPPPAPTPTPAPTPAPQSNQQEQQVRDAIKGDGRIAKATLAQILGREPSSVENIGGIKVKEYFLNRQVYVQA